MNIIHQNLRRIFIIAITAIAVISFISIGTVRADSDNSAQDGRLVTIHDRGTSTTILTHATTVGDVIRDAHIKVIPKDTVEPDIDTKLLATNYTVNIYRAKPVIVVDGDVRIKILTSRQTADGIAREAGLSLVDEDEVNFAMSSDTSSDGVTEIMNIKRAKKFTINLYGTNVIAYSQMPTVGAMLKEKGVTLGINDTLSVRSDAKLAAGMTVEIWHHGQKVTTVEEKIPFTERKVLDYNQPLGYRKVKTEGKDGVKDVVYEITIKNGKPAKHKVLQSFVVTKPREQVVVIGMAPPAGSHQDWMAKAGISSSDFGYVTYIIDHENRSWDPCKVQGGAVDCLYAGTVNLGYGLVQATPGNKMAAAGSDWQTNPVTQLKWANSYAVGRYGSWQAAYQFKYTNGWW